VTGSDRAESTYTAALRAHGIEPAIGHDAANVPDGAEVVYSTAVPPDNPERRAAAGRELHRADLLAQIAALRRCLAVTGTHGKTTTAAMVVQAMRGSGLDPSYVIGGELRDTGSNAGWGTGEWIVIEADESDRSLLKFEPEIAVLTNAEARPPCDVRVAARPRADAPHVHGARRRRRGRLGAPGAPRAVAHRGPSAYDAPEPLLEPTGASFSWRGHEVVLTVPGAHNAVNAAGALTASALAGADPARRRRRFEELPGGQAAVRAPGGDGDRGRRCTTTYAHHPTRGRGRDRGGADAGAERVVAVFQPHLYSRTRALAGAFGAALASAAASVVVDVYPARERAEGLPGRRRAVGRRRGGDAAGGRPVAWMPTFDDARRLLGETPAHRRPVPGDGGGRRLSARARAAALSLTRRSGVYAPPDGVAPLRSAARLPVSAPDDDPHGGAAEWFVRATSLEQLEEILRWASGEELEVGVVGSGSNLL